MCIVAEQDAAVVMRGGSGARHEQSREQREQRPSAAGILPPTALQPGSGRSEPTHERRKLVSGQRALLHLSRPD